MTRKYSVTFVIAGVLTLCGGIFLTAQMIPRDNLELISRLLLAAGCITVIVYATLGGKVKSRVYSGFVKPTAAAEAGGITFEDVAANHAAKASLMGIADYIRYPGKYADFGARMPRGVLLYGPPGTGKTLLARALAGEAGVPFFALSGSDFVHMYVGVGAGRVRELFGEARKAGKCVIFIDEIDALGKRRNDTASEERDQTLNALLSEMSGFREGDGVVVVAATNRIDALDAALLRPGRFDRHIEVGLPTAEERLEIMKLHIRNKPLSENVDLVNLAKATCTFSGAAIEALLNEAAISAVQRNSERIDSSDINKAFYRVIAGEDGKAASDADERCAIAVHEAGHAVVMKRLQPETSLKRISILAAAKGAAGYNLAIPKERTLMKKADIEAQIAVLMAGRAAELIVGGEEALTSGASGDLSRAAELAADMILELGMGGEPAIAMRALSNHFGSGRNGEELCRTKLNEMYQRARDILEDDIELLMKLTEILLEKETIEEKEIDEIFV